MFFLEVAWFPCPRLTSHVLQAFLPAISLLGVKCKKEFPSSPFSGNFYRSNPHCPPTALQLTDAGLMIQQLFLLVLSVTAPGFCPSLRACVDGTPAAECLRLGFEKVMFSQRRLKQLGLLRWMFCSPGQERTLRYLPTFLGFRPIV